MMSAELAAEPPILLLRRFILCSSGDGLHRFCIISTSGESSLLNRFGDELVRFDAEVLYGPDRLIVDGAVPCSITDGTSLPRSKLSLVRLARLGRAAASARTPRTPKELGVPPASRGAMSSSTRPCSRPPERSQSLAMSAQSTSVSPRPPHRARVTLSKFSPSRVQSAANDSTFIALAHGCNSAANL